MRRSPNDAELESLLRLLDDPDSRIADAVLARLRARGEAVIDPLLDFVDLSPDELARERAQTLAREFHEAELTRRFELLRDQLDEKDPRALEDGAFLLSRIANPRLDVESYRFELDILANRLQEEIRGVYSAQDLLRITNHFFFNNQGFRGNQGKFLDADNSYIDKVLDRRMGIPISLAVVYLLVTQYRLGLPFSGASAPGHFLIRYDGLREEPLFIDAFNGGAVLRTRDIKRFLDASGLPFSEAFLEPAEPRAILLRMMRNLLIVFTELHDTDLRQRFKRYMAILAPQLEEEHDAEGDEEEE